MSIKIYDREYPVTAKFQSEVLDIHPDLASMTYEDLMHRRDEILRLSTARGNYQVSVPDDADGTLTPAERLRLDNIVHVMNLHHAIHYLRGRSHTEFGFDGVDQVHGCSARHSCGCVTQHVFDHHKARAGEPHEHHPHISLRSCDKHAHLMGDFKAHRAAVYADGAAKE